VAASPRDAAAGASLVITMLPAAPHVRAVSPARRRAGRPRAGATVIDCSTIDPATARRSARRREHGGAFADAPVSGGTGGAAAGTLTFMVGAAPLFAA
jgi:3-hydroxyisobutyrate dehydrogenase